MPIGGSDPAATLRDVAASLVSEHAPVVIGLVGPDETLLALDGALVERLGYRREDVVGRPFTDLVQDLDDRQRAPRGAGR